ncbi:MAG: glycosyltransferase family 9 protein [Acidobacteriota bacterium]|nr:hypothetical protein [Blastocatellia bacterium]MDW8239875.1 glycosyltransferase family 9 protein [Acidobacteriota bacterium]
MPIPPLQREPHRILILHLGSLAEVILSLPALHAVRERFARAHLTLLATEPACETVAMTSLMDEYVPVATQRLRQLATPWGAYRWLRLPRYLRQQSYNWVLDLPSYSSTSLLTKVTQARVHWSLHPSMRIANLLGYVWPPRSAPRQHVLERYLGLIRSWGIQPTQRRPVLPLSLDVRDAIDKQLRQKGYHRDRLLIGLYPQAAHGLRQWPPDWFVALGERLNHDLAVRLLLASHLKKDRIIRQVAKQVAEAITLQGLTMPELAAAMAACTLLVTDDPGLANLAAAVQTPVLGLGLNASLAPRGDEHRMIQPGRFASTLEEAVATITEMVTRQRSTTLFQ